ncbi:MAG: SWIM zinc finger family protein [Pseudomonadota bacterium]
MSAAIDFTYQYGFPSGIETNDRSRPKLALATCNADHAKPYFFEGKARSPRALGQMLYTLSEVVRTHFFLPRPALLDPVLTSNEELLRLEGFSGCCGVYARVDLPAEAFEGECQGRGTTNVDFNTPMRNALLRMRDEEDVEFAVGKDEVVLSKNSDDIIEKKVKLPLRWIKGFSEVQAYQPRLDLKIEASAAEALRFIRTLPKTSKPKMPSYAVSVGRGIRLTQRVQKGAVQIQGTHRVKVIETLLAGAKKMRIWADEENGTSAWEVCFEPGSFFLMISPEVYRGFSGEGQILADLANPPSDDIVANVRAQLKWSSQIDVREVAEQMGISASEVEHAIALLSTRGLAGYDALKGKYFHRELPFDLSQVEDMQPRLKSARKLIEEEQIHLRKSEQDTAHYDVAGAGTTHQVRLTPEGDDCTCPWFSKNQGKRGPCKHVLAAQIVHEKSE